MSIIALILGTLFSSLFTGIDPGYERLILKAQIEKMDEISKSIIINTSKKDLLNKLGCDEWGNRYTVFEFPAMKYNDTYLGNYIGKSIVVICAGQNGKLDADYNKIENTILTLENDDIALSVYFINNDKDYEIYYNNKIYCKHTLLGYKLSTLKDRIVMNINEKKAIKCSAN